MGKKSLATNLCCLIHGDSLDGFCPRCPNYGKIFCEDHSDSFCPICKALLYSRGANLRDIACQTTPTIKDCKNCAVWKRIKNETKKQL